MQTSELPAPIHCEAEMSFEEIVRRIDGILALPEPEERRIILLNGHPFPADLLPFDLHPSVSVLRVSDEALDVILGREDEEVIDPVTWQVEGF